MYKISFLFQVSKRDRKQRVHRDLEGKIYELIARTVKYKVMKMG